MLNLKLLSRLHRKKTNVMNRLSDPSSLKVSSSKIALSLLFIFIGTVAFSQSKKIWIETADNAYEKKDYATAAVFYAKVLDDTTVLRSYVIPYEPQLVNLKMKSLFKVP